MEELDKIFAFLNGMYGAPKYVVVFFWCIAFGFGMKRAKWVANQNIPVLVMLWGAVWLPLMSDFKTSIIESPRVWVATNVAIGFMDGALAWICHRFIFKPLLVRLGIQDGNTDFLNNPAQPQTPKQTDP